MSIPRLAPPSLDEVLARQPRAELDESSSDELDGSSSDALDSSSSDELDERLNNALLMHMRAELARISNIPIPNIEWSYRRFSEANIPEFCIKDITFTYYRCLTSDKIPKEDLCTPCLEEDPTINFCSQHAFHLSCLVNQVYACSQKLIEGIKIFRTDHINVEQPLGWETYSHSIYTLTIPGKNLPDCPNCRRTDGMVRLEAVVSDRRQGPIKTKVVIEDSRKSFLCSLAELKIFDHLTTILTIFEAFLSHVQNSTPALAGRIFAVQKLLLIGDVAIVARNYILLYSLIKQKLETLERDTWYKKHAGKIALLGIPVIGLATKASVSYIDQYFKSAIDPQELLKNIPISDIKSVSCKWAAIHPMQYISQIAITSRIVSELFLAYFSNNRLRHLSNTILQTFTLFNVSQLQWLCFERTLLNPLKTIPFKIQGDSAKSSIELYQKAVENIQMNFVFLFPVNSRVSDYQTSINSVYEYSSNFFKNSVWHGTTRGSSGPFFSSISKVFYKIQLAVSHLEFPIIEDISTLITTQLGPKGVFTTIPTLIFRQ